MTDGNTEDQKKDYEILKDDYPEYDLSFKVIVIGDSGKKKLTKYNKLINNRRWKIMFISSSNKA